MRRRLQPIAVVILALVAVTLFPHLRAQDPTPQHIAPTPPLSPEEERSRLRLPDGVQITLFAAEPVIGKPMNMAFDSRGRLWVSQSFEYPFPAADPGKARDRITILEDTDGDGRADRYIHFAEHLNIPIGVLPVPQGAIAYSIPNIWLLRDTNGDDQADRREILTGPFGYADTHGMVNGFTWGLDGRIYACHGFANRSHPQARDGTSLKLHSGNTFRFTPDGTRLEQFTWGQVNPFGLVFDRWGNLYSADCHSRPLYLLLRLGYFPSFGKPHDGLGFVPEICTHGHGSTAIAGIAILEGEHWSPEHRGLVLTGNVVTNRVNADRLRWHGSTPVAEHWGDFVVSEDPWFRPVDMELGPDGALYIADFYNRIIGHYEVPLDHPGRDRHRGRIWRIVPEGAPGPPDPLPAYADAQRLIEYLGHENPTVRMLSANELVFRIRRDAIPQLRAVARDSLQAPLRRALALWVLRRLDALDPATIRSALAGEELVRVHAVRVLGDLPTLTDELLDLLRTATTDPSPRVRRAAAEALALHPHPGNVSYIVHLVRTAPSDDPLLRHAARIALREHLYLDQVVEQWHRSAGRPPAEVFADVAAGARTPQVASALLATLRATANRRLTPSSAEFLASHLPRDDVDRFARLIAEAIRSHPEAAGDVLAAAGRGFQKQSRSIPPSVTALVRRWIDEQLNAAASPAQSKAIELAKTFRVTLPPATLTRLCTDPKAPAQLRAACLELASVTGRHELLAYALKTLEEPLEEPPVTLAAVDYILALEAPAGIDKLRALLRTLPANAALILAARMAQRRAGAIVLLEEAERGNVPLSVLARPPIQVAIANSGVADAQQRLTRLLDELPPQSETADLIAAVQAAEAEVRRADATRGRQLFEKHCAPCHRVGNEGGEIGPQLDGIGLRGLARLAEDVLDPSRIVDQAFWRTLIRLNDGRVLSGLVRESTDANRIVLIDETAQEHLIDRSEVEEMRRVRVSPMPANFGEVLSRRDLYDLLAYLLSLRETSSATLGASRDQANP